MPQALAASAPPLASAGAGTGPEASARIAYVDWCDQGAIGGITTSGSGAEDIAAADWSTDPRGLGGSRHFADSPDHAFSSVVRKDSRLTAVSGVSDVRFNPDCRAVPGASPGTPVAAAFGRGALLTLDSASSSAWWSADSGPQAKTTVRGLEILGRPADVSDGDYARTFTADSGTGKVAVAVTAEQGVSRFTASEHAADSAGLRAAAGLSVRFEVARIDAEGNPVSGFEYSVEFAGAAVRVPDTSGPLAEDPRATATPTPPPTPTPIPTPSSSTAETGAPESAGPTESAEPTGPADPGNSAGSGRPDQPDQSGRPDQSAGPGGSGGSADPLPTDTPTGAGTGSAAGDSRDRPPGAAAVDGTSSATADAPTQQDPAPGPTVAAPTDPEHAPSVDPGGTGQDPADSSGIGRLPVAGGALAGLVATGLAALGGGGTAIYLGRGRKSGLDRDDIGHKSTRCSRSTGEWD
ncbi:hypothetical protein GCM10027570_32520 [Streptomonospora sediminis]